MVSENDRRENESSYRKIPVGRPSLVMTWKQEPVVKGDRGYPTIKTNCRWESLLPRSRGHEWPRRVVIVDSVDSGKSARTMRTIKTKSIDFCGDFVDTPREFLDMPLHYNSLISASFEVSLVLLLWILPGIVPFRLHFRA